MSGDIVFVLSDARSGSTLVDQLLGSNDRVTTVGEVHWLAAYITQNRDIYNPVHPLICSCTKQMAECEFWLDVANAVGCPLESLRLRPRFFSSLRSTHGLSGVLSRVSRHLKYLIEKHPAWYRQAACQKLFDGPRVAADSIKLFDAVLKVSKARCVIDSSKSAFRFRPIFESVPDRVRVILLARDYRAVVHSKMNRGKTLDAAARGWRNKVWQMEALTMDVNPASIFRLKYEEFCQQPAMKIKKLCDFLDLEFSEDMLIRRAADLHHIGGSPSKFDSEKSEIRLDQKYLTVFTPSELQRLRLIVGDSASIWGYQ